MTRKELAQQVFFLLRKDLSMKDIRIWQAIAETDDNSLLQEYEKLIDKYYEVKS